MTIVLTAVLLLPFGLAFLRTRPRAAWFVTVVAAILPVIGGFTNLSIGVLTVLFLLKSSQAAAGHEKPNTYFDFVLFLFLPVVVRWQSPRSPNIRRAVQTGALGMGQILLFRTFASTLLNLHSAIAMIAAIQLALYLALAGWANLVAVLLNLRGLDFDPPFRNPLFARTPADFWGRRWNTWMSDILYRYVFIPVGGRRHPIRGSLLAFAVSGLYHEAAVLIFAHRVTGWMLLYFSLHGLTVAATSRSRTFRRLSRRAPLLTWSMTVVFVLSSGIIFLRAIDGAVWQRCCAALFQ